MKTTDRILSNIILASFLWTVVAVGQDKPPEKSERQKWLLKMQSHAPSMNKTKRRAYNFEKGIQKELNTSAKHAGVLGMKVGVWPQPTSAKQKMERNKYRSGGMKKALMDAYEKRQREILESLKAPVIQAVRDARARDDARDPAAAKTRRLEQRVSEMERRERYRRMFGEDPPGGL